MTSQKIQNNRSWNYLFIHLMAWCILFILPSIFLNRADELNHNEQYKVLRMCIQPICFALIFYINYFVLIDKLLFRKKITQYIIYNLALIIFCCIAIYAINHLLGEQPPIPEFSKHLPPPPRPRPFMPWQDPLILSLTVGLSVAIKITQKWIHTENERKQLEQERTEAELMNLKNQLNPHFLFNTLNNIYSLIAISPNHAQDAVLDLSKLLRYMLYENNQSHVAIEKELEFNRNYIELMRLRLARHVKVEVSIPEEVCQGKQIAPLLFISLIENAFKHGTSATENSFVKISMSEPSPGVIECYIENSYFPKNKSDKSGSGIGLKNLSRQLELLYLEKYSLKTERNSNSFCATLMIDLN